MDFIWILLIIIAVACTLFCCYWLMVRGGVDVNQSENSGDRGKLENFTSRNINIKC